MMSFPLSVLIHPPLPAPYISADLAVIWNPIRQPEFNLCTGAWSLNRGR